MPSRADQPTEYIPRVAETEYIPRVQDFDTEFADDGYHGYADDDAYDEPPNNRPPTRGRRSGPPPDRGRNTLRTVGELLITGGMVVLLFVVYELYVTDIFSAQKQNTATSALDHEWDTVSGQRTDHFDLAEGHGIAKMYIPALGQDYRFTIVEGTSPADLAIGPGHYPGSALPGQPGDFAVAGHRVGQGAPFNDLDLVASCDAIIVETADDWFVYRMLPQTGEVSGWADGKGRTPQCAGTNGEGKVVPLGGQYAKTVGQEIVLPAEGDVVAPVPHYPQASLSAGQEASLMTLTTCNPKFSASQRLIVHAVLVKDWKKDPRNPSQTPPEMKEQS